MGDVTVDHSDSTIPLGINWGAFFLTWIWAIRNRCLNIINIVLLLGIFLPYIGPISALALSIYNGATGNRRAWRRGKWRDHDHFVSVQRRWSKWGIIQFIVAVCFIFICSFLTER